MSSQQPVPFGRYELVHRLSQGRTGEVHLARLKGAAGFEKLYVLKTLAPQPGVDPQLFERFVHAGRLLVSLKHSNIVQVYELGQLAGAYYMALEYVAGVELARVLARARQLGAAVPLPIALYLGQKVAEALGYMHRKKSPEGTPLDIVHRDISPHNVRVSFDGEVKVMDFSLARSAAAMAQTLPSTVVGKLGYMSPEQARAEKVDARSDIYSCGVVLWELLAGRRLYEATLPTELLAAMAHPVVPALHLLRPDISPSLEAVLHRALAPAASDRLAQAEELARALNEERIREGAHVGDEEVRAWVRALCSQELADQRRLVSTLISHAATPSRPVSQPHAVPLSQERVTAPAPVSGVAGSPRGRVPLMVLGAVCLVLTGALGAVLMSPGGSGTSPAPTVTMEASPGGSGTPPALMAGVEAAPSAASPPAPGQATAAIEGGTPAGEETASVRAAEAAAAQPAAASAQAVAPAAVEPSSEPAPRYERVTPGQEVYEVFEDRGEHYLRVGRAEGLRPGMDVQLLGPKEEDGRRPLYGTAVVMEVSGQLARLRPDAKLPEGSVLFAAFRPEPPEVREPEKSRPARRRQTVPVAAAPAATEAAAVTAPEPLTLQGKVTLGGFGPTKAITLYNQGAQDWTKCELRLPSNKRYTVSRLAAGDVERIMLLKFRQEGAERDVPLTGVDVACAEGSARLRLEGT